MKRLLLLLAVAAMLLTVLTAGPAFAAQDKEGLPPFGDKFTDPNPNDQEPEPTPGDPQTPENNPATPTELQGENCYGEDASNFLKGPGDAPDEESGNNPGSAAKPSEQFDSFNGPFISSVLRDARENPENYPDVEVNPLSDFQNQKAEDLASCGDTGKPE